MNLSTYVNDPNFHRMEEFPNRYEITMNSARDFEHHGRYVDVLGTPTGAEKYLVVFYKTEDHGWKYSEDSVSKPLVENK